LLLPFCCDVVGEFVVALRSGNVGLLGEDAVLAAFLVGRGDGFEFGFEGNLVSGVGGSKTEDKRSLCGESVRAREKVKSDCEVA